ncbi:MAG TPA: hypothetical protein VGN17_24135 [Bryobacteraceae bacterium]
MENTTLQARLKPWGATASGVIGWAAAGWLGLAAVVSHAQNQQPAAGAALRFQIFTADSGRVFRVDTETGEAAIYREGTMPGSNQYRYNYWQRVDDRWIVHDQSEESRQAMSSPR